MARFALLAVALFSLIFAISLSRFNPFTSQPELTSKAILDEIYSSPGTFDSNASRAVWFNKDVPLPGKEIAALIDQTPEKVLGETSEEKWIEIDLTAQKLYAHEGSRTVFTFPISSGLPWLPTVTGEFHIWAKIRAARMTGGSVTAGTFYDLPNVPFIQYFYGGYGIHGAYWHNDFGKPRSHGCVNLSVPDAEKLFFWTNPPLDAGQYSRFNINPSESTRVVIHGTTPPP